MRRTILGWLAVMASLPATGRAQSEEDLAALRRDLAELRAEYAQRLDAMEARLAQAEAAIETRAAAPFSPPPLPQTGLSGPASANAFNPAIGLILDAEWRELSRSGDGAPIPGFPLGEEAGVGEPGLSLGESELNLYANIDTKFYGGATLAFANEEGESGVEIEEAYLETLALPAGLSLKAGRMFSPIGYLNILHAHTDDFTDRPLPYRAFLNNQLADEGVQLRWLAPTALFVEVGAEVLRGEGFPIAGAADDGKGAWTAFAHVGGDIGASHSWRAGISTLSGEVAGRASADGDFFGDTELEIVDFIWKWAPNGNPAVRNFKLQAEYLRRNERGSLVDGVGVRAVDVDHSGWYLQGVYQFRPQWRVGLRVSQLQAHDPGTLLAGTIYDPGPGDPRHYSTMVDWSSSEFGRVRLQYNHDSSRLESDDQWLMQYIMSVGAHGAHRF